MEWPERLRQILQASAVNRAEAERRAGLARNRIGQMEAGHEPGVLDAIRLCRFLGITVEQMFGADVPKKAATPRQAADRALSEALDRVAEKSGERPAQKQGRGKGRKSA